MKSFLKKTIIATLLVSIIPLQHGVGENMEVRASSEHGHHTVKKGDTLYSLSKKHNATVSSIQKVNKLKGTNIHVGQLLKIPVVLEKHESNTSKNQIKDNPKAVTEWPSTTYIVKPGDTASIIARQFGTTPAKVLSHNYMTTKDWFNAGQKIAINGYAPRNFDAVPGEAKTPSRYGKPLHWFLDGQYILKRNTNILVTDTASGKSFKAVIMGGMNHADIEPLTPADTKVMKALFKSWTWTPRPVSVHFNGMNIAGSLSGMPHSFDTTPKNGVSGHFDLYLRESKPHNPKTLQSYITQHMNNIPLSTQK